jgi:hypothetical protein
MPSCTGGGLAGLAALDILEWPAAAAVESSPVAAERTLTAGHHLTHRLELHREPGLVPDRQHGRPDPANARQL